MTSLFWGNAGSLAGVPQRHQRGGSHCMFHRLLLTASMLPWWVGTGAPLGGSMYVNKKASDSPSICALSRTSWALQVWPRCLRPQMLSGSRWGRRRRKLERPNLIASSLGGPVVPSKWVRHHNADDRKAGRATRAVLRDWDPRRLTFPRPLSFPPAASSPPRRRWAPVPPL